MMRDKISILIADDHPLIRKGLREFIEEQERFVVIAEADDGEQALALIEQLRPTVSILDIDMPKRNGLEVAHLILQKKMPTRVVILTMHKEEEAFNRAMEVGVMGYVLKDNALTEIVSCLNSITEGKPFFSSNVSHLLFKQQGADSLSLEIQTGLSQLTSTERKVLSLIAINKTSKEIGEKMFISVRTVDNHRANIISKLNLHGTNTLVRFALEHKHLLV